MSTNVPTTDVPPPRTRLPWWRAMLFGLQHVIVMYTGCVAVPLVFGAAMGLDQRTIGILVNADLLVAGVITIIQRSGSRRFSGRVCPSSRVRPSPPSLP